MKTLLHSRATEKLCPVVIQRNCVQLSFRETVCPVVIQRNCVQLSFRETVCPVVIQRNCVQLSHMERATTGENEGSFAICRCRRLCVNFHADTIDLLQVPLERKSERFDKELIFENLKLEDYHFISLSLVCKTMAIYRNRCSCQHS